MELATVGAVLAFAIKLEGRGAELYDQAASLATDSNSREAFLSLAEAKGKRRKLLERSRREFVNEMLLEPIEGLDGSDYLIDTDLRAEMDSDAALRWAVGWEEVSRSLYVDAAQKISHLPQLARVFKKLGKESAGERLSLQSLVEKPGAEA
jgi:rubrerythrin